MLKPPKIIITDIDEDPQVKRAKKVEEITDWSGE